VFNPTSASALMIETPISPLRRRMIEDMTVRKFEARTQETISEQSKALAHSSGRRRTRRGPEDLRRYRLRLVAVQPGLPPRHRWPRSTSAPRCTCCGAARQ
jgi:hypothetical protein